MRTERRCVWSSHLERESGGLVEESAQGSELEERVELGQRRLLLVGVHRVARKSESCGRRSERCGLPQSIHAREREQRAGGCLAVSRGQPRGCRAARAVGWCCQPAVGCQTQLSQRALFSLTAGQRAPVTEAVAGTWKRHGNGLHVQTVWQWRPGMELRSGELPEARQRRREGASGAGRG